MLKCNYAIVKYIYIYNLLFYIIFTNSKMKTYKKNLEDKSIMIFIKSKSECSRHII